MYYVIQVAPGTESRTEELIRRRVDSGLYGRCFHPLRHVRRKLRGEWRDVHEKLIPGYVFLTSTSIEELYQALRQVPSFTRLLGREEGDLFLPLPEGSRVAGADHRRRHGSVPLPGESHRRGWDPNPLRPPEGHGRPHSENQPSQAHCGG